MLVCGIIYNLIRPEYLKHVYLHSYWARKKKKKEIYWCFVMLLKNHDYTFAPAEPWITFWHMTFFLNRNRIPVPAKLI